MKQCALDLATLLDTTDPILYSTTQTPEAELWYSPKPICHYPKPRMSIMGIERQIPHSCPVLQPRNMYFLPDWYNENAGDAKFGGMSNERSFSWQSMPEQCREEGSRNVTYLPGGHSPAGVG